MPLNYHPINQDVAGELSKCLNIMIRIVSMKISVHWTVPNTVNVDVYRFFFCSSCFCNLVLF